MELTTTTLAIFAIVAAMGLVGAAITVIPTPQEAAAGCEKGAAGSLAFNASKGRCFRP